MMMMMKYILITRLCVSLNISVPFVRYLRTIAHFKNHLHTFTQTLAVSTINFPGESELADCLV